MKKKGNRDLKCDITEVEFTQLDRRRSSVQNFRRGEEVIINGRVCAFIRTWYFIIYNRHFYV